MELTEITQENTTLTQKMTQRHYGIDLMKILAMLLITATHYIAYSNILESPAILPVNSVFLTGIFLLSRAAINLFVMITGFLLVKKDFSGKRIVRTWFDTIVISLLALPVGILFFGMPEKTVLLKSILPVSTFSYWYINTYIMLLCVAPLLNLLISKMHTKAHLLLCCGATLLITVMLVMNPFADSMTYVGHAHGIVWFAVLYLWGGCFARESFTVSKAVAAVIGTASLLLLTVLYFLQNSLSVISRFNLFEINSLLMVAVALAVFILLKDISIKSKGLGNFVRILANASLFVYLIQEHNALRNGFWALFKTSELAGSYYVWIDFFLSLVCLWPFAFAMKKVTDWIWPIFEKIGIRLRNKIKKRPVKQREE